MPGRELSFSPMPDCVSPILLSEPEAVYFLSGMGVWFPLPLSPPCPHHTLASEAAKSNQSLHPRQAGMEASS